jgi:hypothetical protein
LLGTTNSGKGLHLENINLIFVSQKTIESHNFIPFHLIIAFDHGTSRSSDFLATIESIIAGQYIFVPEISDAVKSIFWLDQ